MSNPTAIAPPAPLPPPAAPKLLLTRLEARLRLGISLGTLEKLILNGELEVLRIGRRVLVKAASVDRLLKKRAISTRRKNIA